MTQELKNRPKPQYAKLGGWDFYSADLMQEYRQSMEEGLDIEAYRDLFEAASKLPAGETKEKIADAIYDLVYSAPIRADYPYNEPSELAEIKKLRNPALMRKMKADPEKIADKIHGAWLGRICGCLLGKPIEGIRTNELLPLLKHSGNYPMYRYVHSTDFTEEMAATYRFPLKGRCYSDTVKAMPMDDDTNYMVLAQILLDEYGRDFTSENMAKVWMHYQPKEAYCTAETITILNLYRGYMPPDSAVYKNVFREWIGAQIRGDYFGYINPGNPEMAADMAFRDASMSHIKNGIYGEMFAAAMIAAAAAEDDIEKIIEAGLSQIPQTSRLYESVMSVLDGYRKGVSEEECFARIYTLWDENTGHGWCHTISNAMIVSASLLYSGGEYGKSICRAVQTGFDTDCNGATVGSVLGMRNGTAGVGPEWTDPIHDTLETAIYTRPAVSIAECAAHTLDHLEK